MSPSEHGWLQFKTEAKQATEYAPCFQALENKDYTSEGLRMEGMRCARLQACACTHAHVFSSSNAVRWGLTYHRIRDVQSMMMMMRLPAIPLQTRCAAAADDDDDDDGHGALLQPHFLQEPAGQ